MKLLLAFLFAAFGLLAQNRSAVVNVSSDPAGACSPANRPADPLEYNIVNGNLWGCKAHVWTLVTGTGGAGTVTSVATACGASGGTITTTGTITGIGVCVTIANESGTGTTANKLVKLTGAPSTAIITATTDTTGIIGVCDSGCGKTGSALIQQAGLHITTVDGGGSVAGNWAIQSTTTVGDTADSGISSTATPPVGALGIYLQTLGGFSTVVTDLINSQPLTGGSSGLVLISTQTLGSAVPTVTFSSIPGTYKALKLFVSTACDTATTVEDAYVQFNGDTAANYSRQYSLANQTTGTVGQELSVAKIGVFSMPCATAFANASVTAEMTLIGYAGTTFFKTGQSAVTTWTFSSQASFTIQDFSFYWANTAAITSILLGHVAGGGNFVTGSVFSLYGLN